MISIFEDEAEEKAMTLEEQKRIEKLDRIFVPMFGTFIAFLFFLLLFILWGIGWLIRH